MGRGPRQNPRHSSSNSPRPSLAFAHLDQGPVPDLHTDTLTSYVTYCVFERRRQAKKTKTTTWLKDIFKLLKSLGAQVKILSYDNINNANAITTADQIPEQTEQLHVYFPRIYMKGSSLSTKCKLKSSMPIRQLKAKLMIQLQNKDFWITPSQLKATRTGKIGWILGGHPELSYRPEYQTLIQPIIEKYFQRKIEFQVEPENESITVGTHRVTQRVLTVRCPMEDVDNLRALFSEIFSESSEENLGYLERYTFITSRPMGQCTKSHLQAILQSQQTFHRNIGCGPP